MVAGRVGLDLLLLGEDGEGTWEALKILVERSLEQVCPGYSRPRLLITPATPEAREAIQANAWKAGPDMRGNREKKVTAVRTAVTHLLKDDALCMVLWHVDADQPWSLRDQSDNIIRFNQDIREAVRGALDHHAKKYLDCTPELRLARLVGVHPHAAIEAWLYLAFEAFLQAGRLYGCEAQVQEMIQAAQSQGFDEILHIKRTTRVTDKENLTLARAFPADRAWDLSPSYRAFFDALCALDGLEAALKRP